MTNLEFIRRSKGLSQTELARRLGFNPVNISMLERGFRKSWPRIRKQLSEVLNVDEDDLFNEDGSLKEVEAVKVHG